MMPTRRKARTGRYASTRQQQRIRRNVPAQSSHTSNAVPPPSHLLNGQRLPPRTNCIANGAPICTMIYLRHTCRYPIESEKHPRYVGAERCSVPWPGHPEAHPEGHADAEPLIVVTCSAYMAALRSQCVRSTHRVLRLVY